jgi:hypothetical protein
MNWDWFDKIYYFNSEMSPQGINKKISYFKGTTIQDWDKHMKAITKWDFRDIGNKIYPDDINVIDYLEPEGDKPFGIHGVISEVINRLRKGIAFITIQKKPGSDFGTGGIYSVKAASLALNLEWGNISIYKNRFREEDPNPRMDKIDFIVSDGYKITADGDWYDSRIGKNKYKSFEKGD